MRSTNDRHPPGYSRGRLHTVAGQTLTLHTEFDVSAYSHASRGRIAVDKAAVGPLMGAARHDLSYLWRLDSAHLSEARAVLATWTVNEARITAFVATWAYERLWLAHAARDLLVAGCGELPEPLGRRTLSARVRELYVERGLPILAPVWTAIVGESVTAGHMARLAIQESALQAAYLALAPRLQGEAKRVVEEIARRREEMISFFTAEARARIARSPQEARMALAYLHRRWRPLRVVGTPDPDEPRAMSSIFRTPEDLARLARADQHLRELLAARPHTVFWGAKVPTPGLLSRKVRHGIRS